MFVHNKNFIIFVLLLTNKNNIMSAKIYNPPNCIEVPELEFDPNHFKENLKKYNDACEQYIKDLKDFVLSIKKGKNIGEIISFPVADGKAEYMVSSMRPLELMHIPLGDAWEFPYVHLLTAKEVNKIIEQQNKLKEFFEKNS